MKDFDARSYLNSFINFEHSLNKVADLDFKLERMRELLKRMGDPQKDLYIIHVAGSKGKGSTCAMIASVLKQAGLRVGLYSSPHILKLNERIRVMDARRIIQETADDLFGDSISDRELSRVLFDWKAVIDEVHADDKYGPLTFYEVLTATALLYFQKRDVDAVVLETGLGGRLDATNVCESRIAVITPISYEHTAILGDTLAAIAGEKAAIIKSQQDVVIAPQELEAESVIMDRCRKFDIQPRQVYSTDVSASTTRDLTEQTFDVTVADHTYTAVKLPLLGKHQTINAAGTVNVVECLRDQGMSITDQHVYLGLASVEWPIRFEIVRRDPLTILDAAHNEASVRTLCESLKTLVPDRKIHLLLGVSRDKNIKEICGALAEYAYKVWLSKADHPRAYTFSQEEAEGYFPNKPVRICKNVKDAVNDLNKHLSTDDVVIVTGSIFVAAEARSILRSDTCTNTRE